MITKTHAGSQTNNVIKIFFESFLNNYQKEVQMIRGSNSVFESVELMDYKLQKTSLERGGSYIKYLKWLVNKRATINPKK